MENQTNTASQIEELTNKAQLLGLFPGPQQYFVQFLTANSGVVGSLADLIQKIEKGTATRNDYIDAAKDFVNIGTATVGMVNPAARVVLGGIGIATNILDYADSRNYNMGVMYEEILGTTSTYFMNVMDYANDNLVDDINKLYEKTINSITNVKSSVINNRSIYDFDYSANFLHTNNFLSDTYYTNISKTIKNYLISSNPTSNYSNLVNSGYFDNSTLNPISIGAFYESSTNQIDNSSSIAQKTFKLLNSSNQTISKNQLNALDLNKDGKLSGTEISTLKTWKDLNEDGIAQTGEITSLTETIYSKDYDTFTKGNSIFQSSTTPTQAVKQSASYITPTSNYSAVSIPTSNYASITKSVSVPTIPNSNFDTLRNSDNVYVINYIQKINWSVNQVKINNSNRTYMIGTNGNDSFDYRYYQATGYFDAISLIKFISNNRFYQANFFGLDLRKVS